MNVDSYSIPPRSHNIYQHIQNFNWKSAGQTTRSCIVFLNSPLSQQFVSPQKRYSHSVREAKACAVRNEEKHPNCNGMTSKFTLLCCTICLCYWCAHQMHICVSDVSPTYLIYTCLHIILDNILQSNNKKILPLAILGDHQTSAAPLGKVE